MTQLFRIRPVALGIALTCVMLVAPTASAHQLDMAVTKCASGASVAAIQSCVAASSLGTIGAGVDTPPCYGCSTRLTCEYDATTNQHVSTYLDYTIVYIWVDNGAGHDYPIGGTTVFYPFVGLSTSGPC